MEERAISRGRLGRWTIRVLYWLAVMAVSVSLVVGLILVLESLDGASLSGATMVVRD